MTSRKRSTRPETAAEAPGPELTAVPEISGREIIRQRLARNGLAASFAGPLDCARALVGLQSQFQQWAEVSIWNRVPAGLRLADLAGLYQRHDLINLWGQRQTLHTYVKEDWDLISDLYEPKLTGRNYAHNRYPDDFAYLLGRIGRECSQNQTISRARLLALVEERLRGRPPAEEYFEYTLIILGALRGLFFGLPAKPALRTFVDRGRIFEEPWRADRQRSLAALESLMLRYFQYYGPASLADFGHWSGLPLGAAKLCLNRLKDRLLVYAHEGRAYWAGREPEARETTRPGVLLLGKFDPLFVSYRHKDWIIPPELQKEVWRKAGWVEALILDGDKAVGTWRHSLKGQKMSLEISQFMAIKSTARQKVRARAERLAKFWEKQLDAVTFT